MKFVRKQLYALSLLLTIPLMQIIYGVLNDSIRGMRSLLTDLDRSLPFVKQFIVPYMVWYVFIYFVLIYLCYNDKEAYYKTLLAVDICFIICFFIFCFYPTTVPRPELTGDDLFTKLVKIVYSYDNPYNCFPSIHCFTSWLMIRGIGSSKIKNKINSFIVISTAITIILSTQFIKQHVLLDAISGIILADIVFNLIYKFDREKILSWKKKLCSLLTMKKKLGT